MPSVPVFWGADGLPLFPWSRGVYAVSRMSHGWAGAGRHSPVSGLNVSVVGGGVGAMEGPRGSHYHIQQVPGGTAVFSTCSC